MKKIVILLVSLASFGFSLIAQDAKMNEWKELSGKLMLSDAQSQQLEGVYKDYRQELEGLKCPKCDKNNKHLSDKEVNDMTLKQFECQKKRIIIKEKYYKKFASVVSARQAKSLLNDKKDIKCSRMKGQQFRKGNNGMKKMGKQPLKAEFSKEKGCMMKDSCKAKPEQKKFVKP